MKQKFKPIKAFLAFIPLTLALSSCGKNFPSVEKLDKMATQLEQTSSSMADDIYQSCLKRTQFISFLSGDFIHRKEEEKNCDEIYKPTSQDVKTANVVLVKYIKSLGKIASNDTVSFDDSFNKFGDSLKSLEIPRSNGENFTLNKSEVDAGVGILKFITNAASREFRRKTLKQAIVCSDRDIQTYINGVSFTPVKGADSGPTTTGGLIGLTQAYIDGILQSEEQQIDTYFRDYRTVADKKQDELTLIQLEDAYNKAMASLRARREAANNYVAILQEIAKLHQEIKTEFQDKAKKEDSCQAIYTTTLQKGDTKDKEVTYNPEELKRLEEIISKHANNLDPLIQKLDKGF
ncbi:MAG: hypothetical protein SAK29_16960 [Scytonema sp. PMC 1069.18]|nr:hypothetical protein [Scytonema sp. PMC 1069.18]MEC4882248.1 hypothetical protein [Scytonema sp. PMC 1070.18]